MAAKTITYTISAVDRATATMDRINRKIEKMTAPYRALAKSARGLSDATGLTKVSRNLGNVAKEADKAARGVLKMGAPLLAIVGGGTIAGLTEMVTQWERMGAETERTSRMLGMTASQLTQMRGAATLAGVSADSMTAGFQSLQDTLQDARWGRNQAAFATLQALGIRLKATKGGAIDTQAAMYDLADRMQRIQKRDPAAARNLARALGVEQLMPMLIRGRQGMQEYEAEARRLRGEFTPRMAQRAQAFALSFSKMGEALEGLKASIADRLAPVLEPFIDRLTNWIAKNRELIAQKVGALFERIANALGKVDFDRFADGLFHAIEKLIDLASWVVKVIDHIGGLKTVAEGFAVYMAGSFVVSILSSVASVASLGMRIWALTGLWRGAGAAAGAAAEAMTAAAGEAATATATATEGAAAGAAGAAGAAEGTAAAGAGAAGATIGRGLLARIVGGALRFINPVTVGAYLGLHSEELGGKSEADSLRRIRAAEAASGGQWTGANFQPSDAAKNASVTQWAQKLNFGGLEKQYGLPPGLLSAVAQVESKGNASAVSPAGAMGLFQFMPATARQYGINPLDPGQEAGAAAKKLSGLLQRYHGNLSAALAAYNWGEGNLDRKGMANAPPETQQYGPKVMAALRAYGGDAGAMDSGQPMPPLNAPPPPMANAAPPVVNVSNQIHVERDGRTSVRTQTPTSVNIARPLAPPAAA